MGSPSHTQRLFYRSTRMLRMAFQQLHQQQQRDDVFCDVVLQAEGEAVVAHCCVLSVCSPFFMEQLGRELPLRGHRVVLELGDVKIGVLRKLVGFLYTAELEATQEEAQEVLAAARRLRIIELESLQISGGRLVKPGPQRQLNRSCLQPSQHSPPPAVAGRAEPSSASVPPKSTGETSQGQPHSLETTYSSPLRRVKLRKVEKGGCWEVVREKQPLDVPGAVGVAVPQPPPDAGTLGKAGRGSPPWAAWRKQGWVPPSLHHGCGQVVPPGDPKEEEVDVGSVEPCLPPGTICVWPCPSSESDEEVDVLT